MQLTKDTLIALLRTAFECLRHPVQMPAYRKSFFEDWNGKGFEFVKNQYLTPRHKIVYDIFYGIPIGLRISIRKIVKALMGR